MEVLHPGKVVQESKSDGQDQQLKDYYTVRDRCGDIDHRRYLARKVECVIDESRAQECVELG